MVTKKPALDAGKIDGEAGYNTAILRKSLSKESARHPILLISVEKVIRSLAGTSN